MNKNALDVLSPLPTDPAELVRGQLRKTSVSQQIHEALRHRILALELAPGENISRNEIAIYYGVSQTPVRDALMKLEEEGLIDIFPQSKTEVSRIDVAQARETQFLRMSLEIEIVKRLAAANGPDRITAARAVLARQRAAHEAGDLAYFADLDRAFHKELFKAVGVANLWELITERSGHIDRLRKLNLPDPGKATEILDCHGRILEAIAQGSPEQAENFVREHLSGTLAQVEQIMARHPAYF
ncbi:GntR family transcriptional regulator [Defluviimonas sp. WL0002]|uniref:GntR family transcriptional regulator n=1 Tax=Albidovulum marisflavi TaxID=2984159 RepID=A0ABT2Z8I8_9RHOB|nr:GntR family transcriptional regulator [Defluviimonas sp. WL0002]MCV2867469.1 GntR family transcriptional regulator [Defluviimonas sp. WL0002]